MQQENQVYIIRRADLEKRQLITLKITKIFHNPFPPQGRLNRKEKETIATYKQIQAYIKDNHGYSAKSCWIAHMKEVCGLNPKTSPNRYSPDKRVHPCPLSKQNDLFEAFRHFNMIEK